MKRVVMEVTHTSSSMGTKGSTRQMAGMQKAVKMVQQMTVRGKTQALGLERDSVGARVLMDSTGVKR